VFGFVRMLKQMAAVWQPTHWAVVFDGGLPEERKALLEDYKSQRPPMPDALKEQMAPVEEYLAASRVAWRRQEGQEADDVLASMASWAAEGADRIWIATSDKDMYQLVDDRVGIVPVTGKQASAMDGEAVKEKTGVDPGQIVDWLALVGDTSDNIPGVPGVGPKTAARLLGQYGSLDGLWAALGDLPAGKLADSLRDNREMILRNVAMVRLRRDLPCDVTWDALEVRSPDVSRLISLFEELEFGSMAKELQQGSLFGA
jgi:DNA polymerase-1